MPSLAELQQRFAAALHDPKAAPPVACSAGRFGVHRRNVASGILGVLEARFPVVRQLVGDEFFHAMATRYLAEHRPRSPILLLYGESFAAFIAHFEPATDVPYLADVAQLEWLQHEAYHAADARPIGADELASIPPEGVADVVIHLHPSLRLLASDWPAHTLWQAHQATPPVALGRLAADAEQVMVLRPALQVDVSRTTLGDYAFVGALLAGQALGAAADGAAARDDGFNFQDAFAGLIAVGAVVGYTLPADDTAT